MTSLRDLIGVNELVVTVGVTVGTARAGGAAAGSCSSPDILSTPLYPIKLLVSVFLGSSGALLEDQMISLYDSLGFARCL